MAWASREEFRAIFALANSDGGTGGTYVGVPVDTLAAALEQQVVLSDESHAYLVGVEKRQVGLWEPIGLTTLSEHIAGREKIQKSGSYGIPS